MEKSKQALNLYEDRIQRELYLQVPTLTDQQHAKVAQFIISILSEGCQVSENHPETDTRVLHLITVPDAKYGGLTAYFQEYPNCVAEGEDLPETLTGLANALSIMFEDQRTGKVA